MIDSVTYQGTREDAKIEHAQKILFRDLKRKFSEISETITQKVLSMKDLEKIDQIGDELPNLTTIQEVENLLG